MNFFTEKEFRIFLIFWIIFSIFSTSDTWNDNASLDLTRAIVDEHRFEIDSYANNTGDKVYYNGHYYSDKVPGSAFLAVPLYQAYKLFVGEIPYHNSLDKENPSWKYKLFLFLVISLTSSVCGALTVVLIYKISMYFTKKRLYQNLITIFYGFGTLQIHAARQFNSHAISTFFIFLCFYLIFKSMKEKKDYYLLAGLSGGFAVLTAYRDIILLLFCLTLVLTLKNWKATTKFLIGSTIFILVLLAYHQTIYDNPFDTHLQHEDGQIWDKISIVNNRLENPLIDEDYLIHEKVSNNEIVFQYEDYPNYFCEQLKKNGKGSLEQKFKCTKIEVKQTIKKFASSMPKNTKKYFLQFWTFKYKKDWNIFLRLLFGPFRGLFFYSPLLLLSFLGLFFLHRKYKLLTWLIITSFLIYMTILSTRHMWWIGCSFGPRHLTPIVPFLMIPLLFTFKKVSKKTVLFLGILSIIISVIGLQSVDLSHRSIVSLDTIGDEYIQRLNSWQPIGNPLFENYIPSLFKQNTKGLLLEHLLGINLVPWANILLLLLTIILIWKSNKL